MTKRPTIAIGRLKQDNLEMKLPVVRCLRLHDIPSPLESATVFRQERLDIDIAR